MVILKNIKKNKEIIMCDFHPEGEDVFGKVEFNSEKGEIETYSPAEGYGACLMAKTHIQNELERLSGLDELPKERTIIWY